MKLGLTNASFSAGSCYFLPLADMSFDRVFAHALVEHLANPSQALTEWHRVLRPGGIIGVCSPDFDGWLLSPHSTALQEALNAYADIQKSNGGALNIGKNLGALLNAAGFDILEVSARYECYERCSTIAEYLAVQLDHAGHASHASILRKWQAQNGVMFAQSWVSAVGRKL